MKRKSAFTFIEVIVAITVFAIGVLAVLRLITQNLVTLDQTQTRTSATFLAKEWIELMYNMRDSNLQKSLPWDCVLDPNLAADDFGLFDASKACLRYFASWIQNTQVLQISFVPTWYSYVDFIKKWIDFNELWSGNLLYYTTWLVADTELHRYSNFSVEGQEPSVFARYISFAAVKEEWKDLPLNKILKIESHVLYMKGSKTGEVVLESFIGNY